MNTHPGLIGKKLGNTQVFQEDGNIVRVTVVRVGPCAIVGKRTVDTDGYSALILGFEDAAEKHVRKPQQGFFQKSGVAAKKTLREFRLTRRTRSRNTRGRSEELKPYEVFSVAGQFARRRRHRQGPRLHRRHEALELQGRRKSQTHRRPRLPASRRLHRHRPERRPHAAERQDARPARRRP